MVEIYTKDYCPFCHRAKALLYSKGIDYIEYDVTRDRALEREMRQRSGGYTVPQIFINGEPVGGSDDLFDLEQSGRLDPLLIGARLNRNDSAGGIHHETL